MAGDWLDRLDARAREAWQHAQEDFSHAATAAKHAADDAEQRALAVAGRMADLASVRVLAPIAFEPAHPPPATQSAPPADKPLVPIDKMTVHERQELRWQVAQAGMQRSALSMMVGLANTTLAGVSPLGGVLAPRIEVDESKFAPPRTGDPVQDAILEDNFEAGARVVTTAQIATSFVPAGEIASGAGAALSKAPELYGAGAGGGGRLVGFSERWAAEAAEARGIVWPGAGRSGPVVRSDDCLHVAPSPRPAEGSGGSTPVRLGQYGVAQQKQIELSKGNRVIGENITVRTPYGRRVTDLLVRTPQSDLEGVEVKVGESRYHRVQQLKDRAIEREGGVATGSRAEGAGVSGDIKFATRIARHPSPADPPKGGADAP